MQDAYTTRAYASMRARCGPGGRCLGERSIEQVAAHRPPLPRFRYSKAPITGRLPPITLVSLTADLRKFAHRSNSGFASKNFIDRAK